MKHVIALSLLVLATGPARAEVAELVTWPDCVRQAAQGNPALAAARETVERSRFELRAEKAAYLPTLSGSASYTRSDSEQADGVTDSSSAGLSAQQTLFAGFGNRAQVRRAEAQLRSAEADGAQTEADVSASLRRAFVRLLYAQQQIALAESIAERRQQNLELVHLRFDVGKEHKGSLLRSEASRKESAYDVEQARRAVRVTQRELATALGRDASDTLVAEGSLASDAPPTEPILRDLARATPGYRRALAQTEATQAAVASSRSSLYPELTARASASRTGEDWPPDQDQWSAGLALAVPLFEGRRNVSSLSAAHADLRRAEANLRQQEQAAVLDLESAWADVQDALQRVDVQAAFLAAAEVRAEIARSQYANGLLTFQNWDQIEDELIQAQKSKLTSDRDAALAVAAWKQARGDSVFTKP